MSAIRLLPRRVHKVWGRRDIPEVFGAVEADEEPVGEVWFEHPSGADAELLVKYLFTSERLSIQAHPDNGSARAAGQVRGKDEAWLVLSAEPDARIALGTKSPLSPAELRQAALDGRIVELVDWRPVQPGELIYSPAGTIHAIGAGLSVIEIQQNCDITYRLYDYGRPRELHLDQGVAAAMPVPFVDAAAAVEFSPGRTIECSGNAFVVERWGGIGEARVRPDPQRPLLLVPLTSGGMLDGRRLEPGSVYLLEDEAQLGLAADGELLATYPGAAVVTKLLEQSSRP
jgi:mannose-6-phosphate isomerase